MKGLLLVATLQAFMVMLPGRELQKENILLNTKTINMQQDTIVPVKIKLEKKEIRDMIVLYIHDTAATTESMADLFGKNYGELMQFINANKLQPVKFMAWYYSKQPPWPMDVAIEADRKPPQTSGRIQTRIQPGGEAIIAHMQGPYDQVGQAYMQIDQWIKENNRMTMTPPFEVYVNDPNTVKSPDEIKTDVYQLLK